MTSDMIMRQNPVKYSSGPLQSYTLGLHLRLAKCRVKVRIKESVRGREVRICFNQYCHNWRGMGGDISQNIMISLTRINLGLHNISGLDIRHIYLL